MSGVADARAEARTERVSEVTELDKLKFKLKNLLKLLVSSNIDTGELPRAEVEETLYCLRTPKDAAVR